MITRYRAPLLAHLVRQFQATPEQAEDWFQAFVHEKVVLDALLQRPRRELGRFRTFLLNALDNFVRSALRKARAAKRCPPGGIGSLDELPESETPAVSPGSDDVFDVDWARVVLAEALQRLEAECLAKGLPARWQVFRARVVDPILNGTARPGYAVLVAQFGFRSPKEAYDTLTTALRAFRRLLMEVIREYEQDPRRAAEEVEALEALLRRARRNPRSPESG